MDAKTFGILKGFDAIAQSNLDKNTKAAAEAKAKAAYGKAVAKAKERYDAAVKKAAELASGPDRWGEAAKVVKASIEGATYKSGHMTLRDGMDERINKALAPLALSLDKLCEAKLTTTRRSGENKGGPVRQAYVKQYYAKRAMNDEADPVKKAALKTEWERLEKVWTDLKDAS